VDDVADQLCISPLTLRTHVQRILHKLGVHSRLEAVAFALREGLIEPPRAPV
jgi:two-component system nitrate/nitrite response regulator NarL